MKSFRVSFSNRFRNTQLMHITTNSTQCRIELDTRFPITRHFRLGAHKIGNAALVEFTDRANSACSRVSQHFPELRKLWTNGNQTRDSPPHNCFGGYILWKSWGRRNTAWCPFVIHHFAKIFDENYDRWLLWIISWKLRSMIFRKDIVKIMIDNFYGRYRENFDRWFLGRISWKFL